MNIVVIGCGKIGTSVVSSLVSEGHDVVVVDTNPDIITEVTNIYDVIGVCGNGADCRTLREASVEKADLLVAATGSDELNMLACFMGRKMGAEHTIARIRNPEYNGENLDFMRQQLGLSMALNPEMMAAHEMFNILKLPSAVKVDSFSRRYFEMIELRLKADSGLAGVKLCDLRAKYKARILICVVQRGEQVYVPDGNFELQSGDRIGIVGAPAEITKFLKNIAMLKKQAKDVMILGGSKSAYYLAKMLLVAGHSVKIIELQKEKAQMLADNLHGATVIYGDGAQQELLLEEGIDSMDAFVALTGIDEENILLSYFALGKKVQKVIAKVNRDEFTPIAEDLGIESIISPKDIVSDIVVRYVRALKNTVGSCMDTLYKVMDGKAEAAEFSVSDEFKYLGIPLKDIHLRKNLLIGGIIRGRRPIVPTGDDVILSGDRVIVIAAAKRLNTLADIVE